MKKTKKYITWAIVVVLLLLDWAALDDITTGNEPSYWEEWDIIFFSLIIYSLIIYSNRKSLRKWFDRIF